MLAIGANLSGGTSSIAIAKPIEWTADAPIP